MIHLFKHQSGKLKGKFDIALVVRGKYIVGSNQGYSRKSGAIKAIASIGRSLLASAVYFQDDTLCKIYCVAIFNPAKGNVITETNTKPSKPYQPQTIKK